MKAHLFSLILRIATLQAATAVAATHVVVQGDTLSRIARKHQCSVVELKSANKLTSDIIRVGQTLQVPEAAAATEPAPVLPPPSGPVISNEELEANLKSLASADRWKVQLFLDQALFAPGKVDGLVGEFTVKAAARWIMAGKNRDMQSLLAAARKQCAQTQTEFVIPESAASFIGIIPEKLEEKAALTTLPYESLAEYAAERFHTDLAALRRLNPGLDLTTLKIGDTLQVPAVDPLIIENWPEKLSSICSEPGSIHLRIHHDDRMIEVLRADGRMCAAFPITVSPKPEHRRTGEWFIHSITANPSFLWDDEMLKNGVKGTEQHLLPPGPNNPVGILWLALQPVGGPKAHIGIHGTADPARIGRNHSSGCIRLANWDIIRLAKMVGKGTRVAWQPEDAPAFRPPVLAASSPH